VLAMLMASILARGDDTPQPVPLNAQCSVPPDPHWTPQEDFVWQHVCVGEVADFNHDPNYGGYLDPRREGLPNSRIISPQFLETILLDDKYRKVLTRRGVIISGALLTGNLDLQNAQLGHYFELSESLLEEGVDFSGLRSTYAVSLVGSNINGPFVMNEGHLGGELSLEGSKITGGLAMIGGQVGGQLGLGGAMVKLLDLHELQFGEVRLVNIHVGGQLNLGGSSGNDRMLLIPKVYGPVIIEGVQVSSTVHLSRGAEFYDRVDFIYSKVGENVELAGGVFHQNVDLTGTQIGGELRLGTSDARGEARWAPNSLLTLRNTIVGTIQDLPNSWPDHLDLIGFSYRNLGGIAGQNDPMINRTAKWFKGWLKKQASYAAAPYQQLASVLRAQGRTDTADEVLYARKQRERKTQSSFLGYLELTASKWFIGYGYHLFRSLYWALGFLVLGFLALWFSGEGQRIRYSYDINLLAYSFDLLLPIIRLREKHYQVDLKGGVGYYFYLHKIMGYVLASFLIAGIAGLTK
jgi:hypothetical protein